MVKVRIKRVNLFNEEVFNNLRKHLEEIGERIEDAMDILQYLYGFDAQIPERTLKTLILLYRVAIGEAAHTGKITPELIKAIKGHLNEIRFFVKNDPKLNQAFLLMSSELKESIPPQRLYDHMEALRYILDVSTEEGWVFKNLLEVWDTYITATQYYIPPVEFERIKTDLQDIVSRLQSMARPHLKTDIERKTYIDESLKLIEKIKAARTTSELHRLLVEHRSLISMLLYLQEYGTTKQKTPSEKDMLMEAAKTTPQKLLVLIYNLGGTPDSEFYIPQPKIIRESPFSQDTTRKHLKSLEKLDLIEGRYMKIGPAPQKAFKLTEKGLQEIEKLKQQIKEEEKIR